MAIGNPVSTTSSSVASKTSSVIATAGQTLFTVPAGYVTNHISVFRNGIRLVDGRDYEARNGATVTLLAAATVGDVIEFHVFDTFSVADAVTNQGGTIFGDLTVEGSIGDITANNVTGVAATFTGAVSVGGVLTYEDVTNVDSIGIMTARSGLNVTSGVVRVGSTDVYNSSDKLTLVNNSGNCSLTIDSTPTGESSVFFADGTSGQDAYRGYLQYNHSNDALLIATSATERIRITSDGKIGINQSTPQTTFHSTGTTNGQQATFGIDNSGLKISTFQKTDNDAGVILDAQKSSNGTLTFATTGTERLRIDSSGRIGIGAINNTSYDSNAQNVLIASDGNTGITIRSAGATPFAMIHFADGTTDNSEKRAGRIVYQHDGDNMMFNTANTERVRITGAGRMGLGTVSPKRHLHIHGGNETVKIQITNTTTGSSTDGDGFQIAIAANGDAYLEQRENSPLIFTTNNTERIRIDSSGRMGLGTNSPAKKLHISDTSGPAQIRITGSSGSSDIYADANIYFQPNGTTRVTMDSSGRLLIGTTAGAAGRVVHASNSGSNSAYFHSTNGSTGTGSQDGIVMGMGDATNAYFWNYESGNIQFATSATARLTITGAGNVGINDSSPSNKLTVRNDNAAAAKIGGNGSGAYYIEIGQLGTNSSPGFNATGSGASMLFRMSGSEKMRLDPSGRLLVGLNSALTGTNAQYSNFIVQGASSGSQYDGRMSLSRGTAASSLTNNNAVGSIYFTDNGSNEFASIVGHVDGTTGSSDAPGRLVFSTTSDGSSSPTERMRIDSSGKVIIGSTTAATNQKLTIRATEPEMALYATPGSSSILNMGDTDNYQIGRILYQNGDNSMRFYTNVSERMRIDSSGNMSLGSSTINLTAAARTTLSLNGANSSLLAFNHSDTISGFLYAEATEFRMEANGTRPLVFRGNNATRMTIDSSGRLLLGTTSPGQNTADDLTVGDTSGHHGITIRSSSSSTGNIFFSDTNNTDTASYSGFIQYYHSNSKMYFGNNTASRMLLGGYGFLHASNIGDFSGDLTNTNSFHSFASNIAQWTAQIKNTNNSPYGLYLYFTQTKNNGGNQFIYCGDSGKRFTVMSNGGIENYSGNNSNLCDEREKKNIVSLDTKWDKVKSWELKKFHYNEDADTDDLRYGVIAQQVEEHCPEVLTEWEKQSAAEAELDEDGNVVTPAREQIMRKGVKEQQMMWMAIKALQEAQTRIETLETANADLLARVTALEG